VPTIRLAYVPARKQAYRALLIRRTTPTSPIEPDRCTSISQPYETPGLRDLTPRLVQRREQGVFGGRTIG
jgi:hypothetical protein